ncbi:MAG: response regulator [Chloroflexota bacterium]
MTNAHILVVDDEPGITRLCERLLRRADYTVTVFTNPAEAIEYFKYHPIDLLLVDIRMPEIGGFEVISNAKQYQPDVAVLVMTGFGTVETAIQALRQGVDGLLLKPFETGNELVSAVAQALEDNQNKRDIARIQALRPLFDITESLLAETRPDRLLDLVLTAVCGHLRTDNAAYYQYSYGDKSLSILASRGRGFPNDISKVDGGLIGQVDATGIPLWVNASGPGDERLKKKIIKENFSSVMCASIARLNVRGVLFAARSSEETAFREVDWEMFLLLSRQATVAMENARLYAELRAYVQRVEESQQALIRAEKMATAGRLTASIAHEINNPLQAVQNCLHLATRDEVSGKKRQEYLGLATTELDRLMSTVQRMLDYYRPGGVDPQPINLAELMNHVISLLDTQLIERGIHVTSNFSSKFPAVLAVSNQLQQVFINIILNAYDAMPEGGELRITGRTHKDTVELLFQDTGPGISRDERTRIFEPFVSTKEGGTGLGLSVSYGIIAAHGGNLDIAPDRGPGACFRITLPVRGEA